MRGWIGVRPTSCFREMSPMYGTRGCMRPRWPPCSDAGFELRGQIICAKQHFAPLSFAVTVTGGTSPLSTRCGKIARRTGAEIARNRRCGTWQI
jgi:hypothetical protein